MGLILNIETSTNICSVALGKEGVCIALEETTREQSHAARLTLLIESVLKQGKVSLKNLDALAVSIGPGSYTGLRIGLSTVKGICYALNKPLIGVDTLQVLAAATAEQIQPEAERIYYCPMIDARRMEVYTATYDVHLKQIEPPYPLIVEPDSFDKWFNAGVKVIFSGDGAEKTKPVLESKNAVFVPQLATAKGMVYLSENLFHKGAFMNTAYAEPFYLKSPNITKPRRRL